ncbi:ABC transporter permease subunit [Sinomonas susongensis]|uniref:ABC transporter permease subunit n=1 Tax=Sinomonas susongensis TaxID=1324851 RepID=UPI001FE91C30|nr:ABC transporter permease subunit [Sinomonas susongensis]
MTVALVVFLLGILPWLSSHDPALAILRARSAEQEATPEALGAIRQELGLDAGPFAVFAGWLGRALTGDWGVSWVSGRPVLPGMVQAMLVSLGLMAAALTVALVVAAALNVSALRRGLDGRTARTSGALAAALTSLPEFLLSALLLVAGAVWLRWFPPYGWSGPSSAVLPALALGVPAGGLLGRLVSDSLASALSEQWVATWIVSGYSRRAIALNALRRSLPSVLPQLALVLVGLVGGAVAVERVFAIPGIGRATLGGVSAQDVPTIQAGVMLLMLLSTALGGAAGLLRRVLLGPAIRASAVPAPAPVPAGTRRTWLVPAASLLALAGLVAAGLPRDPYSTAHGRLAPPSVVIPLGADASGRDLLARVAHGALTTIGTAALVTSVCLAIGLALGLCGRAALGPIEVAKAVPPVIAGLVVVALIGASATGAAIAVAAVGWAPLAAHTAALTTEARAQAHVQIAPVLGTGRARTMLGHVLPGVVGPVVRHAALRLPGTVLALAALGFLGMGPQPPHPDWGLVLAEGMAYVERAPSVVLGPLCALVLLAVSAVSLSGLSADLGRRSEAG